MNRRSLLQYFGLAAVATAVPFLPAVASEPNAELRKQFQEALKVVSDEGGWTVCEPSGGLGTTVGGFSGVTQLLGVTARIELEDGFRRAFNNLQYIITRISSDAGRDLRFASAIPTGCPLSATTRLFVVRDDKTNVWFGIFTKHIDGQKLYFISADCSEVRA
jgi:peptide subunit release factor RF-3